MDPYNSTKIWASKILKDNENVPNRAIVFDLDDTLVNTSICIDNKYFPAIQPIVDLAHLAKKLGYYVIIITARQTLDKDRVLENLKLLNIEVDAVFLYPFNVSFFGFTKEERERFVKFKPLFRYNLEKIRYRECQ